MSLPSSIMEIMWRMLELGPFFFFFLTADELFFFITALKPDPERKFNF